MEEGRKKGKKDSRGILYTTKLSTSFVYVFASGREKSPGQLDKAHDCLFMLAA
jgi:hypothetical protein